MCGAQRPDLVFCEEGHPNPPFFNYCSLCGKRLRREAPKDSSPLVVAGDPVAFVEKFLVGKAVQGLVLAAPRVERVVSGFRVGGLECRGVLGHNPSLMTVTAIAVDEVGISYVAKLFSHELVFTKGGVAIARKTFRGAEERVEGYRIAGELNHPNVVKVFRILDKEFAVLTEYCAGGSLAAASSLDRKKILEVLLPIIHVLVKLHEKGYVHGDVKPENILFTGDGVPKLCDFGLTAPIGAKQLAHTPPYTPGAEKLQPWLDVHAVAVILEELMPDPDSRISDVIKRAKREKLSSRELLRELAAYYLEKYAA